MQALMKLNLGQLLLNGNSQVRVDADIYLLEIWTSLFH